MTQAARYDAHDGIAIISISNPPVNAASFAVRSGLADGIQRALADPSVAAIVICCDGRTFIAGADIREFGKPPVPPNLPSVVAAIEASSKPVIASLHGTVLGGGLEVALGAHYRIALPDTRF